AKLKVGAVDDAHEREADRAADAVTSGREALALSHARPPAQEDKLAPEGVGEIARLPGRPLDPSIRRTMESPFRYDFGDVRVHADGSAARAADSIGARAFTSGRHIAFGHGEYAPSSRSGMHLLAHELAHVVQQQGAAHDVVQRVPAPTPAPKPKFYQEVI